MNPLEDRIGYKFRNPLLLAEALTHPSVRHETQLHHFDNQRLEFLGDAVLQLVMTGSLWTFQEEEEGTLTKLRRAGRGKHHVHAAALQRESYRWGRGEERAAARTQLNNADAFEALVGAIYPTVMATGAFI